MDKSEDYRRHLKQMASTKQISRALSIENTPTFHFGKNQLTYFLKYEDQQASMYNTPSKRSLFKPAFKRCQGNPKSRNETYPLPC